MLPLSCGTPPDPCAVTSRYVRRFTMCDSLSGLQGQDSFKTRNTKKTQVPREAAVMCTHIGGVLMMCTHSRIVSDDAHILMVHHVRAHHVMAHHLMVRRSMVRRARA